MEPCGVRLDADQGGEFPFINVYDSEKAAPSQGFSVIFAGEMQAGGFDVVLTACGYVSKPAACCEYLGWRPAVTVQEASRSGIGALDIYFG